MAFASPNITAYSVEATEFPDLARRYRVTGVPIYKVEERPVLNDNPNSGDENWPTQPFPVKPPVLARNSFNKDKDMVTAADTTEHAMSSEDVAIPAAYLVAFAGVLGCTAVSLRRRYETGTTTGDVLYPVTRTQSGDADRLSTDARSSTVSPGNTVT